MDPRGRCPDARAPCVPAGAPGRASRACRPPARPRPGRNRRYCPIPCRYRRTAGRCSGPVRRSRACAGTRRHCSVRAAGRRLLPGWRRRRPASRATWCPGRQPSCGTTMSTRISLPGAAACSARAAVGQELADPAGAVHAVVVAELIRDLDADDAGLAGELGHPADRGTEPGGPFLPALHQVGLDPHLEVDVHGRRHRGLVVGERRQLLRPRRRPAVQRPGHLGFRGGRMRRGSAARGGQDSHGHPGHQASTGRDSRRPSRPGPVTTPPPAPRAPRGRGASLRTTK